MRWFVNDKNGLTVPEILALSIGGVVIFLALKFHRVDVNLIYALCALTALCAGQTISVGWSRGGALPESQYQQIAPEPLSGGEKDGV